MSQYGIPYMGSKAGIIASIAMNFPRAKHFYDLFGGGFSVTHYMLKNKANRYQHFHYNEIKSDIVDLIRRAIGGEYSYKRFKPAWISREDFLKKKDTDAYVRVCWSFGNNQKNYMFGRDIESYKKSMHQAVVFGEFDELAKEVLGFDVWPSVAKTIKHRRFYLRQKIEFYRNTKIPKVFYQSLPEKQLQKLERLEPLEQLQKLQQLEQLERLQQLQQLEQLERLQKLENSSIPFQQLNFSSMDYRDVKIEKDSIVYCDIPYKSTSPYGEFDHEQFFDWAATRPFPVYISEYQIDDSRFKLVYEIDKRPMFKNTDKITKIKQEKLYWNGVSN